MLVLSTQLIWVLSNYPCVFLLTPDYVPGSCLLLYTMVWWSIIVAGDPEISPQLIYFTSTPDVMLLS